MNRDQAVKQLMEYGSTEKEANAILDDAVSLYPNVARTNFLMISSSPDGADFAVSNW